MGLLRINVRQKASTPGLISDFLVLLLFQSCLRYFFDFLDGESLKDVVRRYWLSPDLRC